MDKKTLVKLIFSQVILKNKLHSICDISIQLTCKKKTCEKNLHSFEPKAHIADPTSSGTKQ